MLHKNNQIIFKNKLQKNILTILKKLLMQMTLSLQSPSIDFYHAIRSFKKTYLYIRVLLVFCYSFLRYRSICFYYMPLNILDIKTVNTNTVVNNNKFDHNNKYLNIVEISICVFIEHINKNLVLFPSIIDVFARSRLLWMSSLQG